MDKITLKVNKKKEFNFSKVNIPIVTKHKKRTKIYIVCLLKIEKNKSEKYKMADTQS